MAYLLDANVLIQAKNAHYSFSFCSAFWDWLVAANKAGDVYIIPKVLDEIGKGKDQLKHWCGMHSSLRAATHPSLPASLKEVATWTASQGYTAAAVSTFLSVADYELVAHAHASGGIVVTHEVAVAQRSQKRVKIPEPCKALGVNYMTPFQMLEAEGASFVL